MDQASAEYSYLACAMSSHQPQDDHGDVLHQGNMEWAIKVLERMENQNTYKELAMDFKVFSLCCHSCF